MQSQKGLVGGGSEMDLMTRLASKLLGKSPSINGSSATTASPSSAAVTSTPRSMPTPPSPVPAFSFSSPPPTAPSPKPVAPATKENVAPKSLTTKPTAAFREDAASPPSSTAKPTLSMADANQGPALRGTKEQLAAARELQKTMLTSKGKAGGRNRLLTTEQSSASSTTARGHSATYFGNSASYAPSSNLSPRSQPAVTRSQTGSLPSDKVSATSSPEQTRPNVVPTEPFTLFASKQPANPALQAWKSLSHTPVAKTENVAPVTKPATAGPIPTNSAWNSFSSGLSGTIDTTLPATKAGTETSTSQAWNSLPAASTSKTEDKSPNTKPATTGAFTFTSKPVTNLKDTEMEEITQALEKVGLNKTQQFTTTSTKPITTPQAAATRQMAGITNTLKKRAANSGSSPPHLRKKVADAASTPTDLSSTVTAVLGVPPTIVNGHKSEPPAPVAPVETVATPPVVKTTTPDAETESKHEATTNGVPDAKTTVAALPETSTVAAQTTKKEDITLDQVKEMFAVVNERIKALEEEKLALSKQLEVVLQAEERRKFLGTDSAKSPFTIDVQSRHSKIENVQVTMGMKVSDLVRRIRVQAKYTADETRNPRITVDGKQVGHGMTLGEVGVGKDKQVAVAFSYDPV